MNNVFVKSLLWVMRQTGLLSVLQVRLTARINGTRIRLLMGGFDGLTRFDVHEPHLLPVFERVLKIKSGAIVDVGSNTGQTLINFLALGDRRPYVAVEPNLAAANQVQVLADVNKAGHVIVIPAALADRAGLALLSVSSRYDLGATIIPKFYPTDGSAGSRLVPVITGDHIVGALRLDGVSLIKIDAEGAEPDVIRGFIGTIDRFRPFIVCELIPLRRGGLHVAGERIKRRSKVLTFLRNRGYVGYAICDAGELIMLNNMTIKRDSSVWEYLFAPKEAARAQFKTTYRRARAILSE